MSYRFSPLVSRRTPTSSWFAEAQPIPGPASIGEITGGRWSRNWLIQIDASRVPRAYQEAEFEPGVWVEILDRLPPIFGTVLPEGARRLSAVFDQSARLIIAYELDGQVLVTRWDSATEQYVQDVSFAGVNPAVTIDAYAGVSVGASDVLIYYQSPDLLSISCRVQRDLFLVPHLLWTAEAPLILDRVQFIGIMMQLLISDAETGQPVMDETGEILTLQAGPYPLSLEDRVLLDVAPTRGRYESYALQQVVEDRVTMSATVLNPDGVTGEPFRADVPRSEADGPANPILSNLEVLEGSLTSASWARLSRGFSQCDSVADNISSGGEGGHGLGWGFGTPSSNVDDPPLGFDVIVAAEDTVTANPRYGIRSINLTFKLAWSVAWRMSGIAHGDPVPELDGVQSVEQGTCNIVRQWTPGSRTVVIEVAQSATRAASGALNWIEADRFTESIEPGVRLDVREYGRELVVPLLSSAAYPFVLVRVRTLARDAGNSTNVFLGGEIGVQYNALTNAYVSDRLTIPVQDAVRMQVSPARARYEDNLRTVDAEDAVLMGVELSRGRYSLHVAAWPHPQDHVIMDVEPVRAEYREVS